MSRKYVCLTFDLLSDKAKDMLEYSVTEYFDI